jgi:hypothetical protein
MSTGNSYLHFDGLQSYIEIPSSPDFSLPTTGALAISAWIRPATLTFPGIVGNATNPPDLTKAYVYWLGKGEGVGATGQQEWVFRMYSSNNTVGRANRISFYVFNSDGHIGVGSYYQDDSNPIQANVWYHIVGAADSVNTYLFFNGQLAKTTSYAGQITPQPGLAPVRIGTRDFNSYFEGDIREVRIWNRTLTAAEVAGLYASDTVPRNGLVAEYLLTQDIAPDTAGSHNGQIVAGTWISE